MGNTGRVLLINGIWRAGTTYVWSKVRENPDWKCYYEPLHEVLSVYHPSRNDDNLREESWKMMRHPSMSLGYFHEYQLAESGLGVPLYSDSLAYERFILGAEESHPLLESYLRSLITYAESSGQRTCFQPNRMFLRAAWFTNRIPSLHVYVSRYWWDIWRSMRSFPNHYFPSRFYLIATLNSGHPLMQPLIEGKTLPLAETLFYTGEEAHLAPWIANRAEVFRFFYYIYVCATVLSSADADVLIDLSVGEDAPDMWASLQTELTAEGIEADFSDCRTPSYEHDAEFDELASVAAEVEALILERLPAVRIPDSRISAALPDSSSLKQLLLRFRGEPAAESWT